MQVFSLTLIVRTCKLELIYSFKILFYLPVEKSNKSQEHIIYDEGS